MFYCPQCHYPCATQGRCPHHQLGLVPADELEPDEPDTYEPPPSPVFPHSQTIEMPIVISDEIHGAAQTDWAAGRKFDSKSKRRDYYAATGLKRVSTGEAQGMGVMGDHPVPNKTHIIPGVKHTHRQGLKWHEKVV